MGPNVIDVWNLMGCPHLSHERYSYSGFFVLPGGKVVCTGKLGSLIETHVYLVGQKTLLNRDPCWVLGSGQLLVIGSWLSYNSANTELITIKPVEMPVPSKLGLASTICAWWRHLHQWLRLSVCLVRTNVPFSYCISLCYVSYFFMFPLILFPPSSSVPLCPYVHMTHQSESKLGVISFAHVSCCRMFVLKPAPKNFGKSLAAILTFRCLFRAPLVYFH